MRALVALGLVALGLVLLSGCHDWDSLSRGYHTEAGTHLDGPRVDLARADGRGEGAPRDAPTADGGRRCSFSGSFSFEAPQLLAVSSGASELDPFVTADGLTLYFSSDRASASHFEVFVAKRGGLAEPFGGASSLGLAGEATHFALSSDGLTAYVAAEWSGGTGLSDLWYATRSSLTQPFVQADFALLTVASTTDWEFDPTPSSDGRRLYYAAVGSGGMDCLFLERATAAAAYSGPKLVPGINTADGEDSPALTADQRVIVFGSTRPGTAGAADLWYALRGDRDAAFPAPARLPVVNSDAKEMDPFLSADGCELYFVSDRAGGAGGLDLYHTRYVQLGP